MKEAVFNVLPVYTTLSQVNSAPVGTYYLWDVVTNSGTQGDSRQQNNTSLRHRITYNQRVASDGSLAGMGSMTTRRVFDLLESDDLGQSTKSAAKPKINTSPTRDDNDRNFIKEGDWS